MDSTSIIKKLNYLKQKHEKVHSLIEALEGEKAPDEYVAQQKILKLSVKDEIVSIENELKLKGIKYE